jgi:antitoxin HigA-1
MTPSETVLPVHPGVFICLHILPASGLAPAELARMMGVSRAALHYILHGRQGITAATALRLAAVFGVSAESWLELQQRYDIARAKIQLSDALAAVDPYRGEAIDFDRLLARG